MPTFLYVIGWYLLVLLGLALIVNISDSKSSGRKRVALFLAALPTWTYVLLTMFPWLMGR